MEGTGGDVIPSSQQDQQMHEIALENVFDRKSTLHLSCSSPRIVLVCIKRIELQGGEHVLPVGETITGTD